MLIFLLFLFSFLNLAENSASFYNDWPLPASRIIRHQLRQRGSTPFGSTFYRRERRVEEHQGEENGFLSQVFECFRPFFQREATAAAIENSQFPESESLSSIEGIDESTKSCEICLESVIISECVPCCSRGHSLHFRCFVELIKGTAQERHKCPLCREVLISTPLRLQAAVNFFDPERFENYWTALEGNLRIVRIVKPVQLAQIDWKPSFYQILTKSNSNHLIKFLNLDLVDINTTFNTGDCAISVLFHGIHLYHLESQRVQRLRDNLQVILTHPCIVLDRQLKLSNRPPRHLIYYAVDSNLFDAFLLILDASDNIDLVKLFHYVCQSSYREVFFNYLLTCSAFDLFAVDEFNCSALHIAIRSSNNYYTLALLESPDLKQPDLLVPDNRDGRSVLHSAMISASDEVVDKLIARHNINWDFTDSYGKSLEYLYENRRN